MNKILSDRDRIAINDNLRKLEDLAVEVARAKAAGIEGAEEVEKRCQYCKDNYIKIKAAYFPGKP